MKKLHFLFLLVGALMILGCKLPVGEGEDQQIALTVTASPTNGGTVTRSPDLTKYAYGTVVTLTANPSPDFQFARWETVTTTYDIQSGEQKVATSSFSENPVTTITMDSDKTVRAVFIPAKPFIQPSQGLIDSDVVTGSTYLHPDLISIQITNDGIGTLSGLAVSFPHGKPGWLSATLSDSTAPATLTARFEDSVLVTVQSMPEGAQVQSLIQITSPVAMNSPQDIDVTVTHVSMPWTPPPGPGSPEPMKVICAELHRQGLMDEAIWKADEAFGSYLNDNHKDVLLGYQLWAKPVVKWMQKSKAFTRIVASVVTPWSYEMAYRMGARSEGTFAGKILMDVGVPICRIIGWAVIWAGNMGSP
jgi:hypothetical protein